MNTYKIKTAAHSGKGKIPMIAYQVNFLGEIK